MRTIAEYIVDQRNFSKRTFKNSNCNSVVAHIKKEIEEVQANPYDLMEWIDIIILSLDGYWRAGGDPFSFMDLMERKLEINKNRKWGVPDKDGVVEHLKCLCGGVGCNSCEPQGRG